MTDSTRSAVIVDAVRSPMGKAREGKPGGALSGVHPVDLLGAGDHRRWSSAPASTRAPSTT